MERKFSKVHFCGTYWSPLLFSLVKISLCLLIFIISGIAAVDVPPVNLLETKLISFNLKAAEKRTFLIDLESNETLRLQIEKDDGRLQLLVSDSNGNEIFSGIYQQFGLVYPWFIGSEKGRYLIEIISLETDAEKRFNAELKVSEKTATEIRDYVLADAEKIFQKAEKQKSEWTTEAIKSAIVNYQEAGRIWLENSRWRNAALADLQIGKLYFNFGDYPQALTFFERGRSSAKTSADKTIELEILCRIAEIHILTGQSAGAELDLKQVEYEIPQIPFDRLQNYLTAILNNRQGDLSAVKGELENARSAFRKSLEVWRGNPDRLVQANSFLNLGYLNFDSGETLIAEQNFNDALKRSVDLGDLRGKAQTLTAQAHLYSLFNQSQKALVLHLQAQEIFHRIGDRQGEAVALNGAGNIYEFSGLTVDAANSYQKAFKINEELANPVFMATTGYALARVYRLQKKFDEARTFYDKSLALTKKLKMKRIETYILNDLAEIETELGNLDLALGKFKKALVFYDEIKDLRGKSRILVRIGNVYRRQNKIEPALRSFQKAIQINNLTKDSLGLSDCYFFISEIEKERGRLPEALSLIEKSIELAGELDARMLSSTLTIAKQSSVYEKIQLRIEIIMELSRDPAQSYRIGEGLETVEQSRSRTLLEILENSRVEPQFDVGTPFFKQLKALENKIAQKIENQLALETNSAPREKLAAIEQELDDLRQEYEKIRTQIGEESNNFSRIFNAPQVSLSDIQSELEPNTVYLSYFLGKNKSYLWVVNKTEVKAIELEKQETLERAASEFYLILTARRKNMGETASEHRKRFINAANDFCQKGINLYQLLLEKARPEITGKRLLVSLDGALQYIPLEALPFSSKNSGAVPDCSYLNESLDYQPLLLSNEVSYTPSFGILRSLRAVGQTTSAEASSPAFAIWADPVYEAEDSRLREKIDEPPREVENTPLETPELYVQTLSSTLDESEKITRLWDTKRVQKFTGFEVNRSDFTKRNLQNYRFLHIATHGFFNTLRPQHSGLIFSQFDERGQRIGGVVALQDIFRLRLNADSVVLSSCESGLGEKFSGEGLMGLKYAFFVAGAKSITVSSWKVDDSATVALMESFYRNLLEDGVPTTTALTNAKIEIFQQKGREDPFFWATFTLHGEYRNSVPPEYRAKPYISLKLAAIAIVSLIVIIGGEFLLFKNFRRKNLKPAII
jgi:CHAT domain-containing protein/tetratricopeptide (TPR) repeat protein